MQHREFIYVGAPIPAIDKTEHADFIFNYQKSVLSALVKKKQLTNSQYEKCLELLEAARTIGKRKDT